MFWLISVLAMVKLAAGVIRTAPPSTVPPGARAVLRLMTLLVIETVLPLARAAPVTMPPGAPAVLRAIWVPITVIGPVLVTAPRAAPPGAVARCW